MQQSDKTAFSPAIAQLAMPDKDSSPLYAIGSGLTDYDKQGKLDRMFDIDVKGKELDNSTKQLSYDTATQKAPIEIENAQVNLDNAKYDKDVIKPLQTQSAQLAVDQKQTERDSGVWDAENQTKKDQATIASANASVADEKAKLGVDAQKAELANAGLTTQINALKLSAAKSDDHITQASYYFYDDANGDGVVNEKDFGTRKDKLKAQGVDEKFINAAYVKAQDTLANLDVKHAEATRKQDLALGIDTKTKRINAMQNEGNTIAQGLGLASWEQLGQVDTTTLTPEQKVKLQSWGKSYSQAYDERTGAKVQDMIISMNASQAQLQQVSSYTQEAIKKGNNVNMFKTVANQVASYVGGDVFDPELAMRNKLFQGALNTQLKIASGTAVSGNEFSRFKDETSTLYKSNPDLFVALKGIAMKQQAQLDGIRQVMGDAPFNAQFGDLKQRVNNLNNVLNSATESTQTEGSRSKGNIQFSASKTPPSTPQTPPKKEGLPDPFAY
jgi:hypothetical protein